MALAPNIHKLLFEAIEAKWAEDNDLMQLVGTIYRDFVPEEKVKPSNYPLVAVSHAQEGGVTDHAATSDGLDDAYELMPILFEVAASTCEVASQIGWQIAQLFKGWTVETNDLDIQSMNRVQPVWSGQDEQGVCSANVLFQVSVAAIEES